MRIGEAKTTKDLLDALNDAVERRKTLRRPYDTQWWNNVALIAGDHYTRWDPLQGEFIQAAKQDHEVRLVLNHALTVGRTELSKLTKARPMMDVVAQSDSQVDLAAAKVGKRVLEGFEWKFKLRRLRKQAFWWMIITGLGATYVGWDPVNDMDGKYEYYIDPTTNEPTWNQGRVDDLKKMVEDGELLEDQVKKEEPLGELDFKFYSPFQLLPDETATEWHELKDLITVDVVDVDVARANWGVDDIEPETGVTPGTIDQSVMFRAGLTGMSRSAQDAENAVAIYTWWLLPGVYKGRYLERGKMIRWCNRTIKLEESDAFPFTDCRMPFAFFEHIPSATSIWPESVLTHIRSANLEMDKTASQLIENKDYMANPMWRVAIQHDLPRDIVSIPGAIIKYRHVPNIPPPEPIAGVPMPSQVENLMAALRSQILDISGQGEISRGNLPTGARSGVQVAYMQEEDETRLGPTAENIEDGISTMSSLALSRVSQFYHTDRLVRIYRRDGEYDVLKFKGADLRGNTDVVVLAGSALPKSKAARQQYVLELVQMGVKRDPKWIMDALELGQGEPDDTDKAYAQATRENHAMVQGVTVGTMPKYYEGNFPGAVQPPQTAPEGAPAGMISTPSPTEITPQVSTRAYGEPTDVGTTKTVFPGPTGAEGMPPGAPTEGMPPEGMPPGTLPPEMMAQAAQMATGEHAPSERTKKGPVAIPVFTWHNHAAHLERHYSFMMDEDFEHIAETRPDIVRLFTEHTAMHEQALEQKRQQQLQQLEAMKGAPGPGGEGAVSPGPPGQSDALLKNEADLRADATSSGGGQ